jgi:hypothetical protein
MMWAMVKKERSARMRELNVKICHRIESRRHSIEILRAGYAGRNEDTNY